jgi:hypothetical protein
MVNLLLCIGFFIFGCICIRKMWRNTFGLEKKLRERKDEKATD